MKREKEREREGGGILGGGREREAREGERVWNKEGERSSKESKEVKAGILWKRAGKEVREREGDGLRNRIEIGRGS